MLQVCSGLLTPGRLPQQAWVQAEAGQHLALLQECPLGKVCMRAPGLHQANRRLQLRVAHIVSQRKSKCASSLH